MAANLDGVLSSVFFQFLQRWVSGQHHYGGIGHDALSTNKLSEAGTVFGHRVSSLFCRVVAVAATLGCCFTRGLLLLGVEGPSSSWDFPTG